MARISDEIINDILNKTDIVDLIGEKVALTQKGKSYFGLCPFHHEKTPSFSVEPERKIYNCFSCGEKGNAITFLQKTENMSFVEALEVLADRANVSVNFKDYKKENPNTRYYNINNEALNFYKLYLSNTTQGEIATKYLHKRGITESIIKTFDFGLAPQEYDLLTKTLTARDILVSDLIDLGLTKQSSNDRYYDLFRERIIIPIKDDRGNTVAFSGRVYLEDSNDTAKYINSPQTKVFTKSNILYNLHNALNTIKQNNRIVLFEGYMDVIAAHRSGIKEAVASMGTSLTQEQIDKMKHYTKNVTICYDGDKAGLAATERAYQMFQRSGMEVKIVLLPDKMDPDDYIKKFGETSLNDFINNKWIDSVEFLYQRHLDAKDFTKMLDIEHFKKTVFDLIKDKSNTIVETYLRRLSVDTKISLESIQQDFEQYTRRRPIKTNYAKTPQIPIESKYYHAERRLINYFLSDFKYLKDFNAHDDLEILFLDERARDIKMHIEDEYFKINLENETLNTEQVIELLNDELKHFYKSKVENKNLELSDEEYMDCRNVLRRYGNSIKLNAQEKKIQTAESDQEKIKLALERDKQKKEEHAWIKKK